MSDTCGGQLSIGQVRLRVKGRSQVQGHFDKNQSWHSSNATQVLGVLLGVYFDGDIHFIIRACFAKTVQNYKYGYRRLEGITHMKVYTMYLSYFEIDTQNLTPQKSDNLYSAAKKCGCLTPFPQQAHIVPVKFMIYASIIKLLYCSLRLDITEPLLAAVLLRFCRAN